MLVFERLDIKHKEKFNNTIKKYQYRNSESSFGSLYMWAEPLNIEIAFGENAIFLRFVQSGDTAYLSPFIYDMQGPIMPAIKEIRSFLHNENEKFCIRGVIEPIKQKIETELENIIFFEDRDKFDYVYESEKLISLSGKKLSGKRNHINYFLTNYEYEYKVYDSSMKQECIELVERWHENKGKMKGLNDEIGVLNKVIREYDDLEVKGAVIVVNGKIEALTFGQPICEDTVLIHMEKANPEIRGLYPFINQQFVKNEWSDYRYINREEDMGMQGLRRAKLSYQPAFLEKKYSCSLDGKCYGY